MAQAAMQLAQQSAHGYGYAPVPKHRQIACRVTQPARAQEQQLRYEVRQATSLAELRAAGYLRAYSFYTYPPDRSEYSARMHRRMKGDAEWECVTKKINGAEPAYQDLKVVCLIATMTDDADNSVALQAAQEMDPSTKLPADDSVGLPGQIVIGSLDMNQGAVLPSEELVGKLPAVW
eukprot:GHRR01036956.1.p1 GENE.GHRR01036956.1~~GHRR01036956.1.p1  ORF type:complete len:177 (+),score=23.17 GHRR01036956.1:148-678(+)